MSSLQKSSISGYTLTEILMVVIVLAIMVTAAVPRYTRTLEQQRCREARDALLTIYAGERVYASVNDDLYYQPKVAADWKNIYMDDPTPPDGAIAYNLTLAGGGSKFTATAKRTGGPSANSSLKIDETRTITSSAGADACPYD